MDRQGWQHDNDPAAMFAHVASPDNQRKLRLAAAACLRRAIEPESDRDPLAPRHLLTVGLMERFADGAASAVLLGAERASMDEDVPIRNALRAALTVPLRAQELAEFCTELRASQYPQVRVSGPNVDLPQAYQLAEGLWSGMLPQINGWMCAYLRDVFGDPFDPVAVVPTWRTADVRTLARGIYDERDWGRMPVLADALLDAGCGDERVLSHCRERLHTRGCWLLDGVLGV
jgi:hypothetical protein